MRRLGLLLLLLWLFIYPLALPVQAEVLWLKPSLEHQSLTHGADYVRQQTTWTAA